MERDGARTIRGMVTKAAASLAGRIRAEVGVLPGLGVFWLICGAAFGATLHDDAHGAFMTLPAYTRTREGEVHQLGSGPNVLRAGLCVRKCSLILV